MQYLIVGSGRLALHLQFYLTNLSIPYLTWSRKTHNEAELYDMAQQCAWVWLAVSDKAIAELIKKVKPYNSNILHSSGAHVFADSFDAHLMASFGPTPYPQGLYPQIPIVTCSSSLKSLPLLPNPIHRIRPEDKGAYHGLCVLAGPGSVVLWQLAERYFLKLGLPSHIWMPYLQTIASNIATHPGNALTGPWVRQDEKTISQNFESLKSFDLHALINNLYLAHLAEQNHQPQEFYEHP